MSPQSLRVRAHVPKIYTFALKQSLDRYFGANVYTIGYMGMASIVNPILLRSHPGLPLSVGALIVRIGVPLKGSIRATIRAIIRV